VTMEVGCSIPVEGIEQPTSIVTLDNLNDQQRQQAILILTELVKQPGLSVRDLQRQMEQGYQLKPTTTFNRLSLLRQMGLVSGTSPTSSVGSILLGETDQGLTSHL